MGRLVVPHGRPAGQAEEAANSGEQRQVLKITKLVNGKYCGATDTPIVDKQERLLTTEAEQGAKWAEHFSEILNRLPTTIEAKVQDPDTDLDVSTETPEKEEIIAVIRSLKNEKTPGEVSLNAELFKAEPEFAAKVLQPLFETIWEKKQLPDDWAEGVIVKISKKGTLSNCKNWRGVTLLSVPSKILTKLIIKRISEAVDQQLKQGRAGYRKGRGRTDQIFLNGRDSSTSTTWVFKRLSTSSTNTQGTWNSTTDRPSHQELLQQLQVQSGKPQIQLRCEDRC